MSWEIFDSDLEVFVFRDLAKVTGLIVPDLLSERVVKSSSTVKLPFGLTAIL